MWSMITGFDKTMFDSAECLNCADSFFIYKYTRTGQRGLGLCDCNNLIHGGQSATTCLLTQQVGFSFGFEVVCFCDWQARGERFDGSCRVHIRVCLDPLGMLWALKGQRGRTGASVSANLVGRWLTSPCPSKCDLGHTFNEIHSTWQAPPLPGLSV